MARALGLAALLFWSSSCTPVASEQDVQREAGIVNPLVDFSARFSIEAEELVLQYEVVNRSHRDLYLLNRLYRSTPTWQLGPNVIYVHLDSQSRTVWLNKKIADIPSQTELNSPVVPFVTPVRSGSSFQEEVRIPIPLRDYRQYGSFAGGPSLAATRGEQVEVTFKQVYFTLGYYWRMADMTEEVQNIEGTEVVFPVAQPQSGFPEFGEFQSDVQQLDTPVLQAREP